MSNETKQRYYVTLLELVYWMHDGLSFYEKLEEKKNSFIDKTMLSKCSVCFA